MRANPPAYVTRAKRAFQLTATHSWHYVGLKWPAKIKINDFQEVILVAFRVCAISECTDFGVRFRYKPVRVLYRFCTSSNLKAAERPRVGENSCANKKVR